MKQWNLALFALVAMCGGFVTAITLGSAFGNIPTLGYSPQMFSPFGTDIHMEEALRMNGLFFWGPIVNNTLSFLTLVVPMMLAAAVVFFVERTLLKKNATRHYVPVAILSVAMALVLTLIGGSNLGVLFGAHVDPGMLGYSLFERDTFYQATTMLLVGYSVVYHRGRQTQDRLMFANMSA
jgi:hypothetical protein